MVTYNTNNAYSKSYATPTQNFSLNLLGSELRTYKRWEGEHVNSKLWASYEPFSNCGYVDYGLQ